MYIYCNFMFVVDVVRPIRDFSSWDVPVSCQSSLFGQAIKGLLYSSSRHWLRLRNSTTLVIIQSLTVFKMSPYGAILFHPLALLSRKVLVDTIYSGSIYSRRIEQLLRRIPSSVIERLPCDWLRYLIGCVQDFVEVVYKMMRLV